MNNRWVSRAGVSLVLFLAVIIGPGALAQAPTAKPSAPSRATAHSAPAAPATNVSPADAVADSAEHQADLYYHFLLGHYYESAYEAEGRSEDADLSIEEYKKALALSPDSPEITERLAEIYAKSQRTDEAVEEAQSLLKKDPDNLGAHRLLARIYVRELSEPGVNSSQKGTLALAIGQFEQILRLHPEETPAAIWLARLYRFDNRHDDAEKILREVLKREPENAEALQQLSQLYVDQGRASDAISLLEKAASRSSSGDLLATLGEAETQLHDYAKAESAFRRAVDASPDDSAYRSGLAQALLSQGKLADALAQYERLTQADPDSAENYLRVAQISRRLGRLDEAEKNLLIAKEHEPDSLEILYNEALLYETQGRFDDAIHILSDAIARVRAKPSQTNTDALGILYELLGGLYRDKEDTANAVHAYQDMGNLSPQQAKRAGMLVIEAYRAGHQIDQALAEVRKDMAADPSDRAYQFSYANLLAEKGQNADAVKYLQALLKGGAQDADVYLNLAQVQERGRQYDDARKFAQQAEQLSTTNSDKQMAWFLQGAVAEREKNYDQAEIEFKKVLDQNPQNGEALNYYGYMLAERGVRLNEAVAMIQRSLQEDPANGAFLDSLGWAYFKQNQLNKARKYLEQAVSRNPHDPTVLDHLGDVYDKLGETERAAQLWERAQTEWQHVLPPDYEPDRVAQLDQKLSVVKKRLAQKSTDGTHPQ
jgi:tetratricopeptide (TPR) repeat protein